MLEAAKGFRRLKAHRQLPILKAALAAHGPRHTIKPVLDWQSAAAERPNQRRSVGQFQQRSGHPRGKLRATNRLTLTAPYPINVTGG